MFVNEQSGLASLATREEPQHRAPPILHLIGQPPFHSSLSNCGSELKLVLPLVPHASAHTCELCLQTKFLSGSCRFGNAVNITSFLCTLLRFLEPLFALAASLYCNIRHNAVCHLPCSCSFGFSSIASIVPEVKSVCKQCMSMNPKFAFILHINSRRATHMIAQHHGTHVNHIVSAMNYFPMP